MKAALTTIIASTLLSTSVLANTFESQHRVGLGYTSTEISSPEYDSSVEWGNGIKLEYGYEFNRIVGINVSYGKNNESDSGYGLHTKIDGSTFKLDTDIGYKFFFDGFTIKPYGSLGLIRYSEEITLSVGDNGASTKWNDTNVFIGTGVRAEFGNNVYSDLRFDFTYFDNELIDIDYNQFSWTIGYKF
ncbi:porin family protein [Vibrio sp. YMD68]|uniref:porin family protein n=1 Tax=Vibrio sp. YMD68 TaxID=3042300 RepID=UPI00249B7BAB|nr:porin family protein [Vibrio sp. YMD68]WGV99730.1 porin family protein [Vibrio sp. YMD68]